MIYLNPTGFPLPTPQIFPTRAKKTPVLQYLHPVALVPGSLESSAYKQPASQSVSSSDSILPGLSFSCMGLTLHWCKDVRTYIPVYTESYWWNRDSISVFGILLSPVIFATEYHEASLLHILDFILSSYCLDIY